MIKLVFAFFLIFISLSTEAKQCSDKNTKEILRLASEIIETHKDYLDDLTDIREAFRKDSKYEIAKALGDKNRNKQWSFRDAQRSYSDLIKFNPECNLLNFPEIKKFEPEN